jgi:hypothetical protein
MASVHAREVRLIGKAGGRSNVRKRHIARHQRTIGVLHTATADIRAN